MHQMTIERDGTTVDTKEYLSISEAVSLLKDDPSLQNGDLIKVKEQLPSGGVLHETYTVRQVADTRFAIRHLDTTVDQPMTGRRRP